MSWRGLEDVEGSAVFFRVCKQHRLLITGDEEMRCPAGHSVGERGITSAKLIDGALRLEEFEPLPHELECDVLPPARTRAEKRARNEEIVRLRESGQTVRSIAEMSGLSLGRVKQVIRDAKGPERGPLKFPNRKLPESRHPERDAEILRSRAAGETWSSIGKRLGLAPPSVRYVAARRGGSWVRPERKRA